MNKNKQPQDADQDVPDARARDVYLLVADNTTEFESALRYVALIAARNKCRAAILYVIEDDGYLHWRFIEKRIQTDKRIDAEKKLWDMAQRFYKMSGLPVSFYVKEGRTRQEVAKILNEDSSIRALVLGAGAASSNPLISYFTGKGLSDLCVPLLMVPDEGVIID